MVKDAWNTRDLATAVLAYTPDCRWRNRTEVLCGRAEIEVFLVRRWERELNCRLSKEPWGLRENRMAAHFAYEYQEDSKAKRLAKDKVEDNANRPPVSRFAVYAAGYLYCCQLLM